ncbi:MAG: P1 family peptidase [Candidatus Sericytochromatia bacterium]|nr:P1 family peptidase [Candidatus Sericytochromatia bacterium]
MTRFSSVLLAGSLTWAALFSALPGAASPSPEPTPSEAPRARLRDLGIVIGSHPTGPFNALTDVPGVLVGHVTLVRGEGRLVPGKGPVRTGITAIMPRPDPWHRKLPAAVDVLNGNGEMTGTHWIRESGWLETPIVLTDTLSVGKVTDGVVDWMARRFPGMGRDEDVVLPVVAECDDGFLNDQLGRHATSADVAAALDGAKGGPVAEGAVGAGTGMMSYGFKGGIGTASRVASLGSVRYTVGALVNTNMGRRPELTVAGIAVGKAIRDLMPVRRPSEGSIIVVLATDAPMDAQQLQRLARRATLGIARTGAPAHHSSGDLVLAFSTGTEIPMDMPDPPLLKVERLHPAAADALFMPAVEAVEEAILNALCMAKTTRGRDGHLAHALPLDRLVTLVAGQGTDHRKEDRP